MNHGLLFATCLAWLASLAHAQAPGVPIHDDPKIIATLTKACAEQLESGKLVASSKLFEQRSRAACELTLPAMRTERRTAASVHELARPSCLVVGEFFRCQTCSQWHLNAGSGFVLTNDGAIVTCYHMLAEDEGATESYLVAASLDGSVFPVREVLAANVHADTCILRIDAPPLVPLPLNVDTHPGDTVYCLSNPADNFGYFTHGIIARFFVNHEPITAAGRTLVQGDELRPTCFMAVTVDFAVGSSGGPILDECGNAVGHVQSTGTVFADEDTHRAESYQITLKQATTARAVLAMIKPK